MRLSTGLRNHLLSGGSMRAALNGGVIRIYAGTPAVSPDAAVPAGASLACVISVGGTGTGLGFEAAAAAGRIQKAPSEVWSGSATADQQVTWFRFAALADDGTESTTALRMQGSVAQSGGDLNMTSTFSIFQPE